MNDTEVITRIGELIANRRAQIEGLEALRFALQMEMPVPAAPTLAAAPTVASDGERHTDPLRSSNLIKPAPRPRRKAPVAGDSASWKDRVHAAFGRILPGVDVPVAEVMATLGVTGVAHEGYKAVQSTIQRWVRDGTLKRVGHGVVSLTRKIEVATDVEARYLKFRAETANKDEEA